MGNLKEKVKNRVVVINVKRLVLTFLSIYDLADYPREVQELLKNLDFQLKGVSK